MPDWTNINPSKLPKYKTTKHDYALQRRKVGVDGVRGDCPDPENVFPGGTMVDAPVELGIGAKVDEAVAGVWDSAGNDVVLPDNAFVAGRATHHFSGSSYEILEIFVGDLTDSRWYGFLVDSGLGTTLHEVPITFDRNSLIKQHMNNPGVQNTYKELGIKMSPIVSSKKVYLLGVHGVADDSQVSEILHPEGLSLVESLIQQKAFIVTNDAKIIDVAAHEWPIDLDKAVDVRATSGAAVKYGKAVGRIIKAQGEVALFRSATLEDSVVPVQDLMPIMKFAESGKLFLLIKAPSPEVAVESATKHGFTEVKALEKNNEVLAKHGEMAVEAMGEYKQAVDWLAESDEPPFNPGDLLWFNDISESSEKEPSEKTVESIEVEEK